MSKQKRIYDDGRPTDGWKRLAKIAKVTDLRPGNVLVEVNHQSATESLLKIVPAPPGSPKNDRVRFFQYCGPDGKVPEGENILPLWHYDLEHKEIREFYRAEKDKQPAKKSRKEAAKA